MLSPYSKLHNFWSSRMFDHRDTFLFQDLPLINGGIDEVAIATLHLLLYRTFEVGQSLLQNQTAIIAHSGR